VARPQRVRLLNRQRRLKLDAAALRALAERVLDGEGADPNAAVEVVLVRDEAIRALNAAYLGQPVPTDVLAFPADADGWPAGETPLLGSVVVSTDRAVAQAAERGLRPAHELGRLVAHGVLHLLGYRDAAPRERARMRRREDRYLAPRARRR
jgi:probable rRNA maturation factor